MESSTGKQKVYVDEFLSIFFSSLLKQPLPDISVSDPENVLLPEIKEAIKKNLHDFSLVVFYFLIIRLIQEGDLKIEHDILDKYFEKAYSLSQGILKDQRTDKEQEIALLSLMEEISNYRNYLMELKIDELEKRGYVFWICEAFTKKIKSLVGYKNENDTKYHSIIFDAANQIANSIFSDLNDMLKKFEIT